ncbi:MAG: hypothetical protein KH847_02850 [Clostridiales bacterium]|nr:hypothetical protein [Clostridiales bacterium]
MLKPFLEAGRIVGTHGVRGELRLEPWCDTAAFLSGFKTLYWQEGRTPAQVESARPHKSLLLLKLAGVDTSSFPSIFFPMRKKVARMSLSFNPSSSFSV